MEREMFGWFDECRHSLSRPSQNITSKFQTQTHLTDFQKKMSTFFHILLTSTSPRHISLYILINSIQLVLSSLLLLYYTNPKPSNPQFRMGSSSIEDFESYLYLNQFFEDKVGVLKDTLLQKLHESMETRHCIRAESMDCRDDSAAFVLKMVAIATILIFGIAGVAIPLVGKNRRFLRPESNVFFAAKAFAAGVILATGFVHMLSDATTALTDPCLPKFPWSKFPFTGFVAMMASLATLVVDFVGTQFYERKQEKRRLSQLGQEALLEAESVVGRVVPVESGEKVFGEEEGGGMHIVGIHAHAAHHRHNHPHGQEGCNGQVAHSHGGGDHSHNHGHDEEGGVRHVVVSQVLELGIVSHSVIIGLSLGVSQSPCTIRPLIAALSFHQFFEGFALGGCISQAQFKTRPSVVMACFFAITTPAGVALGTGLASLYNPNSPRALAVEGILDSISAGILIYMALVDLIAADFLSKRMKCNVRLQVVSYFALFLGASLMSLLAIWA